MKYHTLIPCICEHCIYDLYDFDNSNWLIREYVYRYENFVHLFDKIEDRINNNYYNLVLYTYMKYSNLLFGLIIGIVLLCVFNSSDSIENFYCPNCNRNNWTGEAECANCHNCGWCIGPNGYGSCGIGDGRGPFFKECRSWFYRGMKMYGSDPSISQPIGPM